ncbi:MAG: ABC transporter ATP-binding protein [Flavobacteriales bacterium TMED84]|nr:MAG: ABC transporter ATP-binding protein [Flavobacteriales bacterium TMED84]
MKSLLKFLSYLKVYKAYCILNVCFNALSSIFSLVSFTMIIPFLGVLFGTQERVVKPPEIINSIESVKNLFYYQISHTIESSGSAKALILICLVILISFLFRNLFRYLALYFMVPIRNGVINDIRVVINKKLLSIPIKSIEKRKKGDLLSRISNDLIEIEWSIMSTLEMLFKDPITIIIFLIALLTLSFKLTLLVIIMFPIVGFIIGYIGKQLQKDSEKVQNQMGKIMSKADEILSGIRTIKSLNISKHIHSIFSNESKKYRQLMNSLLRKKDLSSPMSEFLSTIVLVIVLLIGGTMVLNTKSEILAQEFIGFVLIFSQLIPPAKSLTSSFYSIKKGNAASKRVFEIINLKDEVNVKNSKKKIKNFNYLEFKDVHFSHENNKVLNGISFKINKGENIAIVGYSGSGKTTICDLINRLYNFDSGEVYINKERLSKYDISSVREFFGSVDQVPFLFNDTIFNNIFLGNLNAKNNDVIKAAKDSYSYNFIKKLPEEFYFNVGDKGNNLSQGEKQRICIARTLIQNPEFLILDEATSSLDADSTEYVNMAIQNIMKDRTCLIITHNLNTIKNCDKILILEKGRIVDSGTHNKLLKNSEIYSNLFEKFTNHQ